MAQVGVRELLEAGVHFGHQTRRWNPKMRRFIWGERGGIYIVDLLKTQALLDQAQAFAGDLASRGGIVLFVGTKKAAQDAIKEVAEASGMPYVNHRWLGGLLTNFQTISNRIRRLHDLERYEADGQLALLPTRERMAALADLEKLRANLGGVKYMQRVPDALFVIDLKAEEIAIREARRLRIPVIGLVDTNCDPDGADYVIPGNDDAMRSCMLVAHAIGDVVAESRVAYLEQEQRARAEEEERVRREAEERARREEEERLRREAEAAAAAQAAQEQLVHTDSPDRAEAEAQVAEAREELGRPEPSPEAAITPSSNKPISDPAAGDGGAPGEPAPPADDPTPTPASPPATEAEPELQPQAEKADPSDDPASPTTPDAAAEEEPANG
jgi:small subunit ribosomal protein S2